MSDKINKRLVSDDEILKLGTIGGDWSFGEVEQLLESEHHKTVVELLNYLVKHGVLLYNEARVVAPSYDVSWNEIIKPLKEVK